MAKANLIYRGLYPNQTTANLPVAGDYLPGTAVEKSGGQLVQLTTATSKRVHILANMAFTDQDVDTAYTTGNTGIGYEIEPSGMFLVRVAAATYAENTPLTVGVAGRFTAATAGDTVVAFFNDTPGAFAAGDFADVKIANAYVAA